VILHSLDLLICILPIGIDIRRRDLRLDASLGLRISRRKVCLLEDRPWHRSSLWVFRWMFARIVIDLKEALFLLANVFSAFVEGWPDLAMANYRLQLAS
jgi:hypothetical protein